MIDLVIRGGQIIDGSGSEPSVGDVAIDAGRIVEVGSRCTLSARREFSSSSQRTARPDLDDASSVDCDVARGRLASTSVDYPATANHEIDHRITSPITLPYLILRARRDSWAWLA